MPRIKISPDFEYDPAVSRIYFIRSDPSATIKKYMEKFQAVNHYGAFTFKLSSDFKRAVISIQERWGSKSPLIFNQRLHTINLPHTVVEERDTLKPLLAKYNATYLGGGLYTIPNAQIYIDFTQEFSTLMKSNACNTEKSIHDCAADITGLPQPSKTVINNNFSYNPRTWLIHIKELTYEEYVACARNMDGYGGHYQIGKGHFKFTTSLGFTRAIYDLLKKNVTGNVIATHMHHLNIVKIPRAIVESYNIDLVDLVGTVSLDTNTYYVPNNPQYNRLNNLNLNLNLNLNTKPEKKPMNTKLLIETVTLVNNARARDMSLADLLDLIDHEKNTIETVKNLPNASKARVKIRKLANGNIKQLTDIIDTNFG